MINGTSLGSVRRDQPWASDLRSSRRLESESEFSWTGRGLAVEAQSLKETHQRWWQMETGIVPACPGTGASSAWCADVRCWKTQALADSEHLFDWVTG